MRTGLILSEIGDPQQYRVSASQKGLRAGGRLVPARPSLCRKINRPSPDCMRHSDTHAIAGQSLDPALLHPAGGVGDDFMAGVKLNAKARVRQHLDYELRIA
jgi:hypothetical protein